MDPINHLMSHLPDVPEHRSHLNQVGRCMELDYKHVIPKTCRVELDYTSNTFPIPYFISLEIDHTDDETADQ